MFKIIKDYPESKLFSRAINGSLKLAHKIDAEILVSITEALQTSQQNMRESSAEIYEEFKMKYKKTKKSKFLKLSRKFTSNPRIIELLKKRLSIVYACVEISSKISYMDEIDMGVSLRCLYEILKDIKDYNFNIENFNVKERKSILMVIHKIFIQIKCFSVECIASYIKIIAEIAEMVLTDFELIFAFLHLIKKIITKYQKLNVMLDADNEGLGLNMYDEYVTDPYATNAINAEIVSNLGRVNDRIQLLGKTQKNLVFEDIEVIIDRILNRDPIPNELAIRHSSGVYMKLKQDNEAGQEEKKEEKPKVSGKSDK